TRTSIQFVSGVMCSVVGMVATMQYALALAAGSINAVDFDPLFLPLGIVLLGGNRIWVWLARIHLFLMALIASSTILVFLLMSEENRSLTFALHDNVGRISGGGLILISQGVLLAAILWIHFAIFWQPSRTDATDPILP
ncbi:MAG: hypothetical protein O2899_07750, partial [Bacteroidetes bacterium]|nr:hypothetical protein [Bacteroidota bacterium]